MPISQIVLRKAATLASGDVEPQPSLVQDPNLLVDDDDLMKATADFEDAENSNAEMVLESFLELYLQINPNPSDDEVHKLATSIRLSKEALEGVVYSMLSDRITKEDEDENVEDEFEDDEGDAEIALNRSIILDPQNIEEEMSTDGEPDEYNARQDQ